MSWQTSVSWTSSQVAIGSHTGFHSHSFDLTRVNSCYERINVWGVIIYLYPFLSGSWGVYLFTVDWKELFRFLK